MPEANINVMEEAFLLDEINQIEGCVSLTIRNDLIGPVVDCILDNRDRGRLRTRWALAQQLLTAQRLLKGQDADQNSVEQLGAVTIVPIE